MAIADVHYSIDRGGVLRALLRVSAS